jgi:hypothetical protein
MSLRDSLRPAPVREADGRGSGTVYLTVAEVAKRFPPSRCGRPVHVGTVTRWVTLGARLRDGRRLRLKADRLPGRWIITPESVDEFIAALTADRSGTPMSAPPAYDPARARTLAASRRAAERAGRELDKYGI